MSDYPGEPLFVTRVREADRTAYLTSDADWEDRICYFPRCVEGDRPDWCGHCDNLPTPCEEKS